jgi:hypothetical protein
MRIRVTTEPIYSRNADKNTLIADTALKMNDRFR